MERSEHVGPGVEDPDVPVRSRGVRRRGRLPVGAVLSATVLLASAGLAQGVDTGPPDIRVRGAAMGTGAHFVFSRPGSAPVEPIFDVSFGAAGGAHDQLGNQNFGFASSFYPGATPATPGSLLGLAGFPIGGQILPPEHPIHQGYSSIPSLIPPWPLATQGAYPGNPGRRVDILQDVTGTIPAPLPTDLEGMTQETVVDENVVSATTNIERFAVTGLGGLNPEFDPLVAQLESLTKEYTGGGPGVRGNSFTLKGLNSRYESVNTGQAARSRAEVTVREVELFGGLLQFFRVRSLAEYAGGPEGAKLTGHTTEVGVSRVLGLEVTFDHQGVKLADRRIPAGQGAPVTGLLAEILNRAGFTVETTSAHVDGNKVEQVALRLVMAEQEPKVPGATFLGRKTTVTLEIGALGSDFQTLPGAAGAGGGPAGNESGEEGGGAMVGVSVPAPGLAAPTSAGAGRPAGEAAATPSPTPGRKFVAPARPGVTGPFGSPAFAGPEAGPKAGGEVAAADETLVAAPDASAAPLARPVARPAAGRAEKPRETLLLLPGVAATALEQREIAAGIEDLGRRLVILAGLGTAAALVVWRRRRGVLQ